VCWHTTWPNCTGGRSTSQDHFHVPSSERSPWGRFGFASSSLLLLLGRQCAENDEIILEIYEWPRHTCMTFRYTNDLENDLDLHTTLRYTNDLYIHAWPLDIPMTLRMTLTYTHDLEIYKWPRHTCMTFRYTNDLENDLDLHTRPWDIQMTLTYLHDLVTISIAVDDGQTLWESWSIDTNYITDQLWHRNDHLKCKKLIWYKLIPDSHVGNTVFNSNRGTYLQMYSSESTFPTEVKITPHQHVHESARFTSRCP
jgi:hypothetical protein